MAAGEPQKAVALCDKVLRRLPGNPAALNISGIGLCMTGRHKQGVARLERAQAAAPDDTELAMNLAYGLIQVGRYADAEGILRKIVSLTPSLANAHNLLAIALEHQARPLEAADAYRQAIDLDGDNPDYYGNLIQLFLSGGPMVMVLDEAETAARRWPGDGKFAYLHACVLRNLGRADKAIDICRKSLAARPGDLRTLSLLGELYADKGDRDRARVILSQAIDAGDRSDAILFSMTAVRRFDVDDPFFKEIQDRVKRSPKSATLRFALARAYESMSDVDAAFGHYQAGNRLTRDSKGPFDIDHALAAFDTITQRYTRALFDAHAGSGYQAARPVFIVGMPRSGSTLIDQILAAHSQVHCLGETMDLFAVASSAARSHAGGVEAADGVGHHGVLADMPTGFFTDLGELTWRTMAAFAPSCPRIADKMLGNFLYIGLIHLALPNAHIVHCRRNPVDTCLSAFQKNFQSGNLVTCDLSDLGRFYAAYDRLMAHWREVLPGRVYDLRYEVLTAEPEAELRKLFAHLDLNLEPSCLAHHSTGRAVRTASRGQVQQGIYRTSVGRWRRYEKHLGPLFKALGPLAETVS